MTWTAPAMEEVFPCAAWWRSSTASRSSISPRRSRISETGRRASDADAGRTAPDELPSPQDIAPEELAKLPVKLQRWLARRGAFEFRYVMPRNELKPEKRPPYQQIWFQA